VAPLHALCCSVWIYFKLTNELDDGIALYPGVSIEHYSFPSYLDSGPICDEHKCISAWTVSPSPILLIQRAILLCSATKEDNMCVRIHSLCVLASHNVFLEVRGWIAVASY
jgi:hypothetical protein